mgnify:CR=1 FL=1
MKRTLAVATVAMLLVALISSAALATGNNTGKFPRMCWNTTAGKYLLAESRWADPEVPEYGRYTYMGGVQVHAGTYGRGAQRIMCSGLKQRPDQAQAVGYARVDKKLNKKASGARPAEDIWNGMYRNIESFLVYAPKGCNVNAQMWTRLGGQWALLMDVTVWNAKGSKKKIKGWNFCPRWGNTTTKVRVSTACPGRTVDLFD